MDSKPSIEVCLSPLLFHLFEPKGKIVVIIDILRATSTICTALHNGAESVIPVNSVEKCMLYINEPNHVCGAERNGEKPEGFEFGNSPFDYTKDKIEGKKVVLTTTNGTRAIKLSEAADKIVVGSFLNITSLCDWLKEQNQDTILFSAGWKNHINFEDSIFAGGVVNILKNEFHSELDGTLATRYLYKNLKERLGTAMKFSSHYIRLSHLGVGDDIDFCLNYDYTKVLPILQNDELVDVHVASQVDTTDSAL